MNLNSMILEAQEIRSIEATSTSKICWSWNWRGSTWILGWYRHSLKMCSAPSQWGRWAAQMKADRWFELLGEPEEDERSLDKPEQWLRLLPQAKKCHMHTKEKKSFNVALAIKSKAHWQKIQIPWLGMMAFHIKVPNCVEQSKIFKSCK